MMTLTAKILAFIFIFFSMLAIGLNIDFRDISSLLQKKILLYKSLLANLIIIPIFALLLVKLVPMPSHVSLAFIILGFMPGGVSAIQFAGKIRDKSTYAGFTSCILMLYAIFVSPFLITFFIEKNITLKLPFIEILLLSFLFIFLPFILGIFICHKKINVTKIISKVSTIIGTSAFFAMIIATLDTRNLAIAAHSTKIVVTMLVFVLGSMIIGWLMGGPERKDREVLAITTSVRNAAVAIFMAMETIPNAKVIMPLMALGALMVFPNMLFTFLCRFFYKDK